MNEPALQIRQKKLQSGFSMIEGLVALVMITTMAIAIPTFIVAAKASLKSKARRAAVSGVRAALLYQIGRNDSMREILSRNEFDCFRASNPGPQPSGSYSATCGALPATGFPFVSDDANPPGPEGCSVVPSDRIITCYCLNTSGVPVRTQLNYGTCTSPAGVSNNNGALRCAAVDCPTTGGGNFQVRYPDNTNMYDPRQVDNGFGDDGQPCNAPSGTAPDVSCPIRIDLSWTRFDCIAPLCSAYLIQIVGRFTFFNGDGANVDPDTVNFTILRPAPIR